MKYSFFIIITLNFQKLIQNQKACFFFPFGFSMKMIGKIVNNFDLQMYFF